MLFHYTYTLNEHLIKLRKKTTYSPLLQITSIAVATLQCSGPIFGEHELLHCYFLFLFFADPKCQKSTNQPDTRREK